MMTTGDYWIGNPTPMFNAPGPETIQIQSNVSIHLPHGQSIQFLLYFLFSLFLSFIFSLSLSLSLSVAIVYRLYPTITLCRTFHTLRLIMPCFICIRAESSAISLGGIRSPIHRNSREAMYKYSLPSRTLRWPSSLAPLSILKAMVP